MRWSGRWRGGRALRRIPDMWILVIVLGIALMIPITAILVDSPLGRSLARRLEGQSNGGGGGADLTELRRRMEAVESDLEEVNRSLTGRRGSCSSCSACWRTPTGRRPPDGRWRASRRA